MRTQHRIIITIASLLFGLSGYAQAQSLKGSRAVMQKQNQAAVNYGYTFLQTADGVKNFVEAGYLVKISANRDMEIHNVSYPYARSEVKLFLDRLSTQYHVACGEKLTVTSLTRPITNQPVNASSRSVHPTGMAVDLRIPAAGKCRSWLESTLLTLEKSSVLDVTREKNPPHYHVAIFTKTYEQYVQQLNSNSSEYVVRKGESLSLIAYRNHVSILSLRKANGLTNDFIKVGQVLEIPNTNSADSSPVNQVAAISQVTHKVRRGDTLWSIASLYGTNIKRIRNENSLSDDVLQIGQVLRMSLISSTR